MTRRRFKPVVFILAVLGSPQGALAVSASCDNMTSSSDLLRCAVDNHPSVLRAKASAEQADGLDAVARQRPNPELDSKATLGKPRSRTLLNAELNLVHTWELGGKRDSRIERAGAEKEVLARGVQRAQGEIFLSILGALYRYRNLKHESEVLEDTLKSFARILKRYAVRPTLAPDQEVSRQVFELAESDAKLRLASNEAELQSLSQTIGNAVGRKIKLAPDLLPPRNKDWPDSPGRAASKGIDGSEMKAARAELRLAQAELGSARSSSWPDVKLGPSVQIQSEEDSTYPAYGLNLAIPLPLFQANAAGRAYASKGVSRAEQNLKLTEARLEAEREALGARYEKLVAALKASKPIAEIKRGKEQVDVLFQRGLVPSSLVIEAKRQVYEYAKTRNEQESTVAEALAKIFVLEGRPIEEFP